MESENSYMTGVASLGSAIEARPQQKPVTLDITDSLNNLSSLAEEVCSRLYGLRDRLFGPEIPQPTGSKGSVLEGIADANCFAGAARGSISSLRRTLNNIDRLSAEINNRL